MDEYIEREVTCQGCVRYGMGETLCADCVVKVAPAADVAPVVHAKWENVRGESSGMNWKCSRCFKRVMPKSPYCPNCGARMDGE